MTAQRRSNTVLLFFALSVMQGMVTVELCAQEKTERRWVFLRSRETALLADQTAAAAAAGISERALARRAKTLPVHRLVEENDLPIAASAIEAVRATGARIIATSRWFNAVSVDATPAQLQSIQQLPICAGLQPVAVYVRRTPSVSSAPVLEKFVGAAALDYGPSLTQLNGMKAVDLHNLGITGNGVVVGMLDDGYTNHTTHEATSAIDVIAEYDFVQRDSNTSVSATERPEQGDHGQGTLSVLGAYMPGKLIGAAPSARFLLGKTEIDGSEKHIEEDLYVEGLEWLERMGADIVSTSLGYRNGYTSPDVDYPISAMDGKTTIVAQGAIIAARKGVLLVTAQGNEGGSRARDSVTGTLLVDLRTMVSPADADSILGVGATASDGELAVFSGTGPTADGRIKPDVVTQGMAVRWASTSSSASYGNAQGTSLSTPLTAGAAALVLSAHPHLNAMQVREAIRATAMHYNDGTSQTATWPNNVYGYGRVDALAAALYHGPIASNQPTMTLVGDSLEVRIFLRSNATFVPDSLRLFYRTITDSTFSQRLLSKTPNPDEYTARVPYHTGQTPLVGYISFADNAGGSGRLPATQGSVLSLTAPIIPPHVPVPTEYALLPNYPNPFNAGTVIRANIPVSGHVEVEVYDILGRLVRTLYNGIAVPPQLVLNWDARDAAQHPVSSGLYVCRMRSATDVIVRKMMHVK